MHVSVRKGNKESDKETGKGKAEGREEKKREAGRKRGEQESCRMKMQTKMKSRAGGKVYKIYEKCVGSSGKKYGKRAKHSGSTGIVARIAVAVINKGKWHRDAVKKARE